MNPADLNLEPAYFIQATGSGDWPGDQLVDAIYRIRGELGAPHLPFLPQLNQGGYRNTSLARTCCCLSQLEFDLASFGWRLSSGSSNEGRLARSSWAGAINTLADLIGQESSPGQNLKIQLLGPISLANQIYLPSGERASSDSGARRDLRDSFLAGLPDWLRLLQEAAPGQRLILQVDEPDLGPVLAGTVASVSGYRNLPAVTIQEVAETYSIYSRQLEPLVSQVILATPQLENALPFAAYFAGITLNLSYNNTSDWEKLAEHLEAGRRAWLGLPTGQEAESLTKQAHTFWRMWRMIGLPAKTVELLTLTEGPGIKNLNPQQATAALGRLTELARAVSEIAQDD